MRKRRGFTLLELSSVIGIVGILAAILLPALARSREAGRRASCIANLMNFSIALQCYANEHERELPWSGGKNNARCLLNLRGDYLPEIATFVCPSDNSGSWDEDERETVELNVNTIRDAAFSLRSSYDYLGAYTTAPIRMPSLARPVPAGIPVAWDIAVPQAMRDMDTKVEEASRRHPTSLQWGDKLEIDVDSANHVPGGSNVLMLDGSIEFIKWKDMFRPWMPMNPAGIAYAMPEPPSPQEQARVEQLERSPKVAPQQKRQVR